jgi:hypothetical protein
MDLCLGAAYKPSRCMDRLRQRSTKRRIKQALKLLISVPSLLQAHPSLASCRPSGKRLILDHLSLSSLTGLAWQAMAASGWVKMISTWIAMICQPLERSRVER